MDDHLRQIVRDLADAIAKSVERDPRVEACRQRARRDGFDVRINLEAAIGFSPRDESSVDGRPEKTRTTRANLPTDLSDQDRRFLRSLRIATDAQTRVD